MHRATSAIARHPTKEIREQYEQMGFHEGWGVVLDQLVGYVKTLQPPLPQGEGANRACSD